jgi:hypothetical protein
MTPQHTGATADDLTTWGTADPETNQNLAATNPPTARPVTDDDEHALRHDTTNRTHRLAA